MMVKWLWTLLAAWCCVSIAGEYPVALVSDPPPAIDGSAERLTRLPNFQMVRGEKHILYGPGNWTGDADLSAEMVVGYDKLHLYVGAKVHDDVHRQSYFGRDLWKGDHLMLVVDYPRQKGLENDLSKVMRIGLSPGDFQKSKPEACAWSPVGLDVSSVRVAALKTSDGYTLEAAIPWSVLKMKPEPGTEFGLDLLAGDSDGEEQDTLLTLGGIIKPHRPHDPARLMTAVLADANGCIDPSLRKNNELFEIASSVMVSYQGSQRINIPDALLPKLKELVVFGRIESKSTAGATYMMQLKLNGHLLGLKEVRNRDEKLYFRHYILTPVNRNGLWYTAYSPDFDPKKNEPFRSGGVTINPYEFRFDVKGLLKPSGNVLEIMHAHELPRPAPLMVRVCGSEVLSSKLAETHVWKPSPTGELPVIVPTLPLAHSLYEAELAPGGAVVVHGNGRKDVVESRYSTRTPGWAALATVKSNDEWHDAKSTNKAFTARTAEFALERRIECDAEHIRVIDKVTNLTQELLPLMYCHSWKTMHSGEVRLGGYAVTAAQSRVQSGEHPVAALLAENVSGALVAEDDWSRAQGELFRVDSLLGLENKRLVLTPGRTLELEFSFYPLEKGDYFLCLNRIRRHWNVNFTIQKGGANVPARYLSKLTDTQLKSYLDGKSVGYAMDNVPVIDKLVTHGTRFREVDMEPSRVFAQRIARIAPDVKSSLYFHSFIANGLHDAEEFQADAMQTAAGAACDYGGGNYPLFLPTAGSAFAKRQDELLEERFALGVTGIFWDELAYSMYKYDYNPAHWDGCSALIDPNTHQIARKITNVTLATLEWRFATAKNILKRGYLIGNGAPQTRTFTQLHFPRFVETGSITNLVLSQLYTPIALGDHLSERNEYDCYRSMVKGLDYGAVYYWYDCRICPTHPTLTAYMYPLTPIELGHGYIIAKERILTNCSGLFSWGNHDTFEAHVYDREGIEVTWQVKAVERDGVTYAEVRIPEGYSVALVRQNALAP